MSVDESHPYRSDSTVVDWARACRWREVVDALVYQAEVNETGARIAMAFLWPLAALPLLAVAIKGTQALEIAALCVYGAGAGFGLWRTSRVGRARIVVTPSSIQFFRGARAVNLATRDTTVDLLETESVDGAAPMGTVVLRRGEEESILDLTSGLEVAKRRVERLRGIIVALETRDATGRPPSSP